MKNNLTLKTKTCKTKKIMGNGKKASKITAGIHRNKRKQKQSFKRKMPKVVQRPPRVSNTFGYILNKPK